VPLETLLESPRESLPPRAVALTFDDGYLDSLSTVAPLLQRYEVPATFFLTSRWLDEPGEYWWDLLERAAASGEPAGHLHARLVHATLDQRDSEVRNLLSGRSVGAARVRPMLAVEAKALAAYPGVTIGAHSMNHLALPDQPADVIRGEVSESCAAVTRVIGTPVNVFAYPYGSYDRVSAAVVRSLCRWGISCDAGPLGESFDAATVPRLEVKRWDITELAARIESRFRLR
jgi:peptidoglycan/xylan/chitin deacetylase (PgdA/CDA1 family)